MSSLMVHGAGLDPMAGDQLAGPIKRKLEHARQWRRRFEPIWHSSLAFAAGQHWLEWERFSRSLVLPDRYQDKELYQADIITEYRTHVLGELGSDDDRPELLLRRDDQPSEDFQSQLNKAVAFGWDYEWQGDEALEEARRLCVDLGTSAIRCRWDPSSGPVRADQVPFVGGQPVSNPQAQRELFQDGPRGDVELRPLRGQIAWEPGSSFNILVPPGVPHERYFPWEGWIRPALLDHVKEEYGDVAADLKEDGDIGSLLGTQTGADLGGSSAATGTSTARLRDHVWLIHYFERPTKQWPRGRVVTLGGNQMKPLRLTPELPYVGPDGTYRSGIAYFHWWRVSGRFWSRSLIEPMKDIQRGVNKRRTQSNEWIDRAMPFGVVEKDSEALNRSGAPFEWVELGKGERQPEFVLPPSPASLLQSDVEAMREDLTHATGVQAPSLGENPSNVSTYSQLALLKEADAVKREQIIGEHKRAIAELVEDSVYDIRRYWGPQAQVMLAGDNDEVDAAVFDATAVPPFFIVKAAKGAAKPRSQAAELKKIEDIWTAAINAGQPLPVRWLYDSYEAGQALELPESPTNDQAEKAELENHLMLEGQDVIPDYFDPIGTHNPIHRAAQVQARLAGDQAAWDRIERHVQLELANAQANLAQARAAAGTPALPSPQPAAPQPPA